MSEQTMESLATAAAPNEHGDVVITREFDAPRDLVFRAWTDPEQLARWYAPNGCTITIGSIDVRPGGTFHHCIRTPTGYDCWCIGGYREITAPSRLVYTLANADEQGNRVEPTSIGMDPEWPAETVVTVTFAEHDGKTTLTLHQTVSRSIAERTGAYPSWLQMLDILAQQLQGSRDS